MFDLKKSTWYLTSLGKNKILSKYAYQQLNLLSCGIVQDNRLCVWCSVHCIVCSNQLKR